MKIYSVKSKGTFYFLGFAILAALIDAVCTVAAVRAISTEGLNRRSVFLVLFASSLLFLTILFFIKYRSIMGAKYSLRNGCLVIHRGKKEKILTMKEISELKLEVNRITFRDEARNHYVIPSDFQDYEELYEDLRSLKEKRD